MRLLPPALLALLAPLALGAAACAIGCTRAASERSATGAPATPSVGAGSGATPASQASSAPIAPAAPAPAVVNLLSRTDAHVTLSSRVDNPRDYPEHLVDGKPETAWNGKTGDTSAWIEVKLDPRVHVDAFEITAGFDKRDLFEKNLRIERLRIERDGALVREVALDVARRDLQRIPVDGPGGVYRLMVVATKPGSNPAWKEVVVSELRAVGTAPTELLHEARLPKMTVAPGSARPPAWLGEVELEGREGPSAAAICAAWRSDVLATVKRMQRAGQGLDGYDPSWVTCAPEPAPPLEGELPLGWRLVGAARLHWFNGVAMMDEENLVLVRPDGATVVGPVYSTANDIGDSPRPIAARLAVRDAAGGPCLVLATAAVWQNRFDPAAGPDDHDIEHAARSCRIEVTRIACASPHASVFSTRRVGKAEAAAFARAPRVELPKNP